MCIRDRKIKDNRRGSTLVEVIVTFALIGMFLLAATTAVSAAMNAFYRMESLSRAIVVSDTILDKAQGDVYKRQTPYIPQYSAHKMLIVCCRFFLSFSSNVSDST